MLLLTIMFQSILSNCDSANWQIKEKCLIQGVEIHFINNNLKPLNSTYLWNFGDNTTSTATNPSHTYNYYGFYCVKLTATNSCGSSTTAQQIFVEPGECTCPANAQYNIPDGTNITSLNDGDKIGGTVFINSSVYVHYGATIRFGPNGKIVVMPGAILVTNDNTFTILDGCSYMWQGIEVWGNTSQPSTSTLQGRLSFRANTTFENAHVGVLLGRRVTSNSVCNSGIYPYDDTKSGGKIYNYASNVNVYFNNCATAIRFVKKSNPDASANYINNVYINGGTLLDLRYKTSTPNYYTTTNNPYYAPANATGRSGLGIYTYGVRNIKIETCSFNNIEVAINSIDSRLLIQKNNIFNTHSKAIYIKNYTPSINYKNDILNNTFTNVKDYAIYLEGGRGDVIKYNYFNVTYSVPQSDFKKGIYLTSSSGFFIMDNTFNKIQNAIMVTNSETSGGTIGYETTGNIFTACLRGITTYNKNPALTIRCNYFYPDPAVGYSKNWIISYSQLPASLANQGTYDIYNHHKPAGNEFNPTSPLTYNQIYSYLTFKYIHHTQDATKPAGQGSLTSSYIINNTTPKQYGTYDPSCGSGLVSDPAPRLAVYNDFTNQINSLQIQYQNVSGNLDKGNTNALITAINGNTSAGNLKNMLIYHSPLSDEVLNDYINSNKSNTPGLFKEVMSPNLPVSDDVKLLFDNKLTTMPGGISNQLQALQGNNPDYRTLTAIKSDIADATMQKQLYQNELVNYYLNNELESEAVSLLENEATTEAARTLLAYYLSTENAVQATAKLSLLQSTETAEYLEFNQLMLSLVANSLTPYDLDSAQIEIVRNIAYSTVPATEVSNARAILWLLYGEEFNNNEDTLTAKSMRIKPEQHQNNETINEYMLSISPNPVSSQSTVWYQLPNKADNATLNIYDAIGRKVKIYFLPVTANSLLIDVTDLPNGAYTYSLSINNTIFESRKMIVIK